MSNKKTFFYSVFCISWVLISLIISQFVIGLPMTWILGQNFNHPFWTGIYYILYYALATFLIVFASPRLMNWAKTRKNIKKIDQTSKPSVIELGVSKYPTYVDIGLAPIGYVVYIFLANAVTSLMTNIFPWFDSRESQATGFSAGYLTGFDKAIAIFSLVILAPLAEEIIMRGWLYGKLRNRLPIWLAIILTSLTFAILHGQWNVGVSTFILSIILCGLREITGTIWSGVLLHMLSNGIAFYVVYILNGF